MADTPKFKYLPKSRQKILDAYKTDDPVGSLLSAPANSFRLSLREALQRSRGTRHVGTTGGGAGPSGDPIPKPGTDPYYPPTGNGNGLGPDSAGSVRPPTSGMGGYYFGPARGPAGPQRPNNPYSGGTYNPNNGHWNPNAITKVWRDSTGRPLYPTVIPYSPGASVAQWITKNAKTLLQLASLFSGIPFLSFLSEAFQNFVYDNFKFMSAVDPADPYGLSWGEGSGMQELKKYFDELDPDADLPNSSWDGQDTTDINNDPNSPFYIPPYDPNDPRFVGPPDPGTGLLGPPDPGMMGPPDPGMVGPPDPGWGSPDPGSNPYTGGGGSDPNDIGGRVPGWVGGDGIGRPPSGGDDGGGGIMDPNSPNYLPWRKPDEEEEEETKKPPTGPPT